MTTIRNILTLLFIAVVFFVSGQSEIKKNETKLFENRKGLLIVPADSYISFEVCCINQHNEKNKIVSTSDPIQGVVKVTCDTFSKAISVSEGTVNKVFKISDFFVVLVKHGDYYTSYSNLDKVYVKEGQSIFEKQEIGSIKTSNSKTILNFEIYYKTKKINPEGWIAIKRE